MKKIVFLLFMVLGAVVVFAQIDSLVSVEISGRVRDENFRLIGSKIIIKEIYNNGVEEMIETSINNDTNGYKFFVPLHVGRKYKMDFFVYDDFFAKELQFTLNRKHLDLFEGEITVLEKGTLLYLQEKRARSFFRR